VFVLKGYVDIGVFATYRREVVVLNCAVVKYVCVIDTSQLP
jgi:hypothetical protein